MKGVTQYIYHEFNLSEDFYHGDFIMKNVHLLIVLFFLCFVLTIEAQTWKQLPGPYGGYALSLAINPQNQTIMYAGTRGGDLYESTTGGSQWFKLYSFGSNIWTVAIDPITPSDVYVGTESGGLFQSTDGGGSWNNISPTSKQITDMVIDPKNNSILYASVNGDGIYKSTNQGGTWSLVTVGLNDNQIYSLAIDPTNSQVLYAGGNGTVYKSQSGGLTWSALYSAYSHITSIVIDPNNTNNLFVGTLSGCYKSIDKGSNWNLMNNGLTNTKVHSLVMSPSNASILFAGTEAGLFKSITGGSSWTVNFTAQGQTTITTICVSPTNANKVYAGFDGDGIYETSDNGSNWQAANAGLSNLNIWKIVADPHHANILYAGTEVGGVYKTTDSGTTWALMKQMQNVYTLAVDNSNTDIIYAGTYGNGVYKSQDGGKTWGQYNNGLSNTQVWDIAIDPSNTSVLYVATQGGIFKSADGASSWVPAYSPLLEGCYSVAIDPNNSNMVFLGSGTYDDYVKKSTDGGSTWSSSGGGFNYEVIFALKVIPGNPTTVYAGGFYSFGFGGTNSGLYSLPYGSSNWTKDIDNFYTSEVAYNPNNPSEIYSSSFNAGIYRSTDGGNSWNSISNSLPYSISDAVCFDSNKVFAAFRNAGIWETNSLITGIKNENGKLPSTFSLSQNFPNPFNPTTTINYSIPKSSFVSIKVYDLLGKEVATIVNEEKTAGNYSVTFNANKFSSGIYFYRMQSGKYAEAKKLILLK